ncbi:lytic transglycosylase domain-containing protein [Jannaschia sp. LMIT008]|uniref:lytic transglycosylase domain-containing protein n=1 Tax=Jannaschia maritima TaxID=3032585 RepID=UPI002810C920|nr:lytic transglycosylase domain-containing protein [Jannaschia sp. LMIT008]
MRLIAICLTVLLSACATTSDPGASTRQALPLHPGETPAVRRLVNKWADYYDVPRSLVHRVIQRESDYRANAVAPSRLYWGMMQILPATARNMGFRGKPSDLLEADTALKYSIRYLRGAWMVSDADEREAMMWYARGYYYEARDQGLLQETGLRGTLWRDYDAGVRDMPALDAQGNVVRAEPTCTPRTGVAALFGDGCPDG